MGAQSARYSINFVFRECRCSLCIFIVTVVVVVVVVGRNNNQLLIGPFGSEALVKLRPSAGRPALSLSRLIVIEANERSQQVGNGELGQIIVICSPASWPLGELIAGADRRAARRPSDRWLSAANDDGDN